LEGVVRPAGIDALNRFKYANDASGGIERPFGNLQFLILNIGVGDAAGCQRRVEAAEAPARMGINYVRVCRQ
jgi:hypothetical protein